MPIETEVKEEGKEAESIIISYHFDRQWKVKYNYIDDNGTKIIWL